MPGANYLQEIPGSVSGDPAMNSVVNSTEPDLNPTSLVMNFLKSKGMLAGNNNVGGAIRQVLEQNAREPGYIPGLRNNAPSTEAQDQAAMKAAGASRGSKPQSSGGGSNSLPPPGAPTDVRPETDAPVSTSAAPAAASVQRSPAVPPAQPAGAGVPPHAPDDTGLAGTPGVNLSEMISKGWPLLGVLPAAGLAVGANYMQRGVPPTQPAPAVAPQPAPVPAPTSVPPPVQVGSSPPQTNAPLAPGEEVRALPPTTGEDPVKAMVDKAISGDTMGPPRPPITIAAQPPPNGTLGPQTGLDAAMEKALLGSGSTADPAVLANGQSGVKPVEKNVVSQMQRGPSTLDPAVANEAAIASGQRAAPNVPFPPGPPRVAPDPGYMQELVDAVFKSRGGKMPFRPSRY